MGKTTLTLQDINGGWLSHYKQEFQSVTVVLLYGRVSSNIKL